LTFSATVPPVGSNVSVAQASLNVTRNSPGDVIRSIASIGAAILAAGVAACIVAAGLAIAMSMSFARAQAAGLGAVALIVVLAIPVLAVITLVGPFAAGVVGGFAGGRPIAGVGSGGGLVAGYGLGFNVFGDGGLDSSVEGLVAMAAILTVMTLIGHFTGLGLSRSARST
jgi:hypothetical protein